MVAPKLFFALGVAVCLLVAAQTAPAFAAGNVEVEKGIRERSTNWHRKLAEVPGEVAGIFSGLLPMVTDDTASVEASSGGFTRTMLGDDDEGSGYHGGYHGGYHHGYYVGHHDRDDDEGSGYYVVYHDQDGADEYEGHHDHDGRDDD